MIFEICDAYKDYLKYFGTFLKIKRQQYQNKNLPIRPLLVIKSLLFCCTVFDVLLVAKICVTGTFGKVFQSET